MTRLAFDRRRFNRSENYNQEDEYKTYTTTEIDRVLAKHYGFTDEELDFIINYDIKYRMGNALKVN